LFRAVAIKLLHPGYAQRPDALARFHTEARHAGALSHQNIARVYDYGEPADGQSPYLVMELVDGPSLSERLAGGSLDTARSMDIIAQAAAGLQAAHAAGLVHRDVKPANLLVDSGGTVKITDFGIANTIGSVPVTATGEVIGTPGYLAPERVAGERATAASDLYARVLSKLPSGQRFVVHVIAAIARSPLNRYQCRGSAHVGPWRHPRHPCHLHSSTAR
jgi:eukaryotic-like serine/threonine-protein kinase